MKIVAISDTHNLHKHFLPLPEADMIIHCGDMTTHGKPSELYQFHSWWKSLSYKHKLAIPGNHDRCIDLDSELVGLMKAAGHFLIDETVEIEGLVFHGSPWVLTFGHFPFMLDDETPALKEKYDKFPAKIDVLVTHGPPFGVRDLVKKRGSVNAGSKTLLNKVLEIKPQVHVFGHIHEGYGQEERDSIKFINAANHTGLWRGPRSPYKECEERPPIVFEVLPRKAN